MGLEIKYLCFVKFFYYRLLHLLSIVLFILRKAPKGPWPSCCYTVCTGCKPAPFPI